MEDLTKKLINLDNLEQFLNKSKDLFVTKKELESSITSLMHKHEYTTYLNFPFTGDSKDLYVDTTENKLYRWDNNNLKYYCIDSNYQEIKLLDGGGVE